MNDYSDADFADASVRRAFLDELREAERRGRSLDRIGRHDLTNAAGAARNAVMLMDDPDASIAFGRLVEMARRNGRFVADVLRRAALASGGGDERNDLGRARQRDDTDAFGF